jgi:hypothetical protein
VLLLEGAVMADTGAGRILAAKGISTVHDGTSNFREAVKGLDHGHTSSAGRGMKNGEEQKDSRFKLIVAIEQWICLVLGVVCIVSGVWGTFLKVSQNVSFTYLAWLGSAYVQTLRVTAVGCLVMGLVLVRRGVMHS